MCIIVPKEINLVKNLKLYKEKKNDSEENLLLYKVHNFYSICLVSFEKGDFECMWIHYIKLGNLLKKNNKIDYNVCELIVNSIINLLFCSFIQILVRFLELISEFPKEVNINDYFKKFITTFIKTNEKSKLNEYIIYQYLYCFDNIGLIFYTLKENNQYNYTNFYRYILLLYLSFINKNITNNNLKKWFKSNVIHMDNKVINFTVTKNDYNNSFFCKKIDNKKSIITLEKNFLDILKQEIFVRINNKNEIIKYDQGNEILGSLCFLKEINIIPNGFFIDKYMKHKNFISIYCYIH